MLQSALIPGTKDRAMTAHHQTVRQYRILAVDDERIVHQMLTKLLPQYDLPVVLAGTALSGVEALRLAASIRPHICLLDIHLGGMDGLELAAHLSARLGYHPRIIFLTAYGSFDSVRQALRLGAIEFLMKPLVPEELQATLKKAVEGLEQERVERTEHAQLQERLCVLKPAEPDEILSGGRWKKQAVVDRIRAIIEAQYMEQISLSSVAKEVEMSPGYVGTMFKEECGVSFRAYLRTVRIAHAKELMRNPRYNITEIARAVGYENLNYFSQAFLLETGVRPSEYRGEGRRWAK